VTGAKMPADITQDLLQAILNATDDQKQAALQVLRGIHNEGGQNGVEPFRSLKEVAQILNVHYTTLWKWRVPGHGWAGRPKYRMSEVLAYLESREFRQRASDLQALRRQRRKWTQEER